LNEYPVDEIVPEIKKALTAHQSAVLHAPPGAGKTTRVPLALLDTVAPEMGKIVMLEPRRIAAVSAARWMARLLGEEVGQTVGYSIRFDSRLSPRTRVEVVTEGILTRRIQKDPGLEGVSIVIFDEFHTRSIHSDLALALCLDIRKTLRDDLRLLVMSATLDAAPVASLLGDAPVVSSTGRQYHVQEKYLNEKPEGPLPARILRAVRTALRETEGDILVFLPGSGEIRACAEALRPLTEGKDDLSLHPLFGDLPFEEQERAILPSERRKIVLATNIAETSLTIEGTGVVIDSGLARSLRYDPSRAMNRLVTVTISRASAEQRKGRAGRLGPGVCYRLYSRSAFGSMVAFDPPEILVSDLTSLVLDLAVWGVKDPLELSWMDVPPPSAWEAARNLLLNLGALDATGAVTEAGRAMSILPLHPRLGRLMLRAAELGIAPAGADLAALLSERDILRRTSAGGREEPEADIAVRLDVLREWRKGRRLPGGADPWALRSVDRTARQLLRLMPPGKKSPEEISDDDAVGRLLMRAFPERLGRSREEGDGRFVLSQGRGVKLPAKSHLGRSRFIVAVNMDAGEKSEGVVHIGAEVSEELVRLEYEGRIETVKSVEWDEKQGRIVALVRERIGAVTLSEKPFAPSDEETIPVLCQALRSSFHLLKFGRDERQFQGRVLLMRRTFPEEGWPDLSDEALSSTTERWLAPFLGDVRTARDFARVDLMAALRALLSWEQRRLLDERAPALLAVPSGRRAAIDYSAGDTPVLAVKLQEMFGMAETPVIAGGRVKVLLHLLSPAGRPVQVTQDLRGFWDKGYQQVKRELRGRYRKHPWPDDPWSAAPTTGTRKKRG
jgi:ATP-dependent helicase HrpB